MHDSATASFGGRSLTFKIDRQDLPLFEAHAGTALTKEGVLETGYDALHKGMHMAEIGRRSSPGNRFSIAELYVEGRLHLSVPLGVGRGGQEFHAVVGAGRVANFGDIAIHDEVLPVARSYDQCHATFFDCQECHFPLLAQPNTEHRGMLIGAVEVVQVPQKVIPSLVWLQRSNHRDGFGRQFFRLSKDFAFEDVLVGSEGEIGLFETPLVLQGDGASEMVKGGPKVVEDFTAADSEVDRDFVREAELPNLFRSLRVDIGDQFVIARFEEGKDIGVEFQNLGLGPFQLPVAIISGSM